LRNWLVRCSGSITASGSSCTVVQSLSQHSVTLMQKITIVVQRRIAKDYNNLWASLLGHPAADAA
jgi:hypothetical protein